MPVALERALKNRAARLKREGKLRGTEDTYVYGTLQKLKGRKPKK